MKFNISNFKLNSYNCLLLKPINNQVGDFIFFNVGPEKIEVQRVHKQ
jgi:hypothetical protein